MAKNKVKPLTKAECDILVCRLQGALYEGDKKRIDKILEEVKKRVKELKNNNMWFGKLWLNKRKELFVLSAKSTSDLLKTTNLLLMSMEMLIITSDVTVGQHI